MWLLFAILSSFAFGLAGFFMKVSSAQRGSNHTLLHGLYISGTFGFLCYLMIRNEWDFSPIVWIAGLIIGIGSVVGNIYFMEAIALGPASLTSPLINSNIVFTVFMSIFIYNEHLSTTELLGVILLVSAVFLLPVDPNEKLRIRNKRWYLVVVLSMLLFFLRNGGLKITEEMNRSNSMILFISYLFGVIWFSFVKQNGTKLNSNSNKIGWIWGLLSGVFSFAGMQLYAVALKSGPASIVSPIFATNSLIVAVLSIIIYKERLSKLQWISLLLLVVGLVTIRI